MQTFISPYNGSSMYNNNKTSHVGGVAQWLGCRSVAGGLSLIYA